MPMEKNIESLHEGRTSFFGNIKRKEEIDESTFDSWKSELQKELPNFWEEMKGNTSR